jgi:hypothetical protein
VRDYLFEAGGLAAAVVAVGADDRVLAVLVEQELWRLLVVYTPLVGLCLRLTAAVHAAEIGRPLTALQYFFEAVPLQVD